jgi:hypothetical protein
MVEVSERVRHRVRRDFPHQADRVIESLAGLTEGVLPGEPRDSVAIERIQVAALVVARGDLRRLKGAVALGRTDWRDLLVSAGLADEDWQDLVAVELAPPPAAHIWTEGRRRRPV